MKSQSRKDLAEQYKNREMVGGIYRIVCSGNGKYWLRAAKELKTSQNRFMFSLGIKSCPETCMIREWQAYGPEAFSFEVLEEVKREEDQTEKEFMEDIKVLLELWNEKLPN